MCQSSSNGDACFFKLLQGKFPPKLDLSMAWKQTTHGSEFWLVQTPSFIYWCQSSLRLPIFQFILEPQGEGRLTCSSSTAEPLLLLSSSITSSCRAWLFWASMASTSPRILSWFLSSMSSLCSCRCSSVARKFFCCTNSAWILSLCVSTWFFSVSGKKEKIQEWRCLYLFLFPVDSSLWVWEHTYVHTILLGKYKGEASGLRKRWDYGTGAHCSSPTTTAAWAHGIRLSTASFKTQSVPNCAALSSYLHEFLRL